MIISAVWSHKHGAEKSGWQTADPACDFIISVMHGHACPCPYGEAATGQKHKFVDWRLKSYCTCLQHKEMLGVFRHCEVRCWWRSVGHLQHLSTCAGHFSPRQILD